MSKLTKNQALQMIKEIDKSDYHPNDWELNFLDSIDSQLYYKDELSDNQSDKLDKIHKKISVQPAAKPTVKITKIKGGK